MIDELRSYMERLFPLPRSLTGEANRETLRILREIVPLTMIEYPSGMRLYDEWVVPDEWEVEDSWIAWGEPPRSSIRITSNKHRLPHYRHLTPGVNLAGYSRPVAVNTSFSAEELAKRLHSLPDMPDVTPYVTGYYSDDWGVCLPHRICDALVRSADHFHVNIESTLKPGSMTVGEYLIPGRYKQEYLISTYICHPSLANDNCSGMVLTALLAKALSKMDLNYSWRIVWVPETIGAIAYLFNNERAMQAIDAGLVVTCVAGPNEISFKQSFQPDHRLNWIVGIIMDDQYGFDYKGYLFDGHGSDERQYSSQGFGINCCSIHSDKYYTYPEYHTSADNLDFISYERMAEMLDVHVRVCERMDRDLLYANLRPMGEPKLGPRGLYGTDKTDAVLVLLQAADGKTPLSMIAKRYGMGFDTLSEAAVRMVELGLLEEAIVKTSVSR